MTGALPLQSVAMDRASSVDEAMSPSLRCHRKILASSAVVIWAFGVFAGIANACSLDGLPATPHHPVTAVHAGDDAVDSGGAPDCDEHFGASLPLPGLVQRTQEQPVGEPLVVATHHQPGFLPISAPVLRAARTAHPSTGVPFSLRIVRLTL